MNRIFVIGDIHGNFKDIRDISYYMNASEPLDNTDTIIQLGDFGGNFFFDWKDKNLKKKLEQYDCNFFIIRGNHDQRPSILAEQNPKQWNREEFFENDVWVESEYPYIKYAMDYPAAYNINGLYTFVFPGAYSIDKYYRLATNIPWFEKEQLSEEEKQTGERMIQLSDYKCDLVLSHTCPIFYEPTDLFLSNIDQNMVDKTMERYLGHIETKLNYKLWLFGHYHNLRIYPSFSNKQIIMLYNKEILDLNKYFETKNPYESLIKIH